MTKGFPGGSGGKESACNAGDPGSISVLGRSPGGNRLQYCCLENPMDRRASSMGSQIAGHIWATNTFTSSCETRSLIPEFEQPFQTHFCSPSQDKLLQWSQRELGVSLEGRPGGAGWRERKRSFWIGGDPDKTVLQSQEELRVFSQEVLSPPALCSCPSARHVAWPFMITHVECVHIPVEQSRFVTGWTTPATGNGSETMWKEACCGLPLGSILSHVLPHQLLGMWTLGRRQAATGQEAGWLSFADDIQLGKAEAVLNDGHESSDLSDGLTQPRINGEFYSGILQTYTCIERWLWLCSIIFRGKKGGIQVLICRSEWMTCETVRKHH